MAESDASVVSLVTSGELLVLVDSVQATKYLSVACFALVAYEYLLTLDQEISLFWRRGFTATRILFFINRYTPFVIFTIYIMSYFRQFPSLEFCEVTFVSVASVVVFEIIVMQAILVVRVTYLWCGRPAVQLLVGATFLVGVTIATTVFGFVVKATSPAALPQPLGGCFNVAAGANAHLYWAMFAPTAFLETVLVYLTILRASHPLERTRGSRLLKCLVRDGVLFYCAVCIFVGYGMVGSAIWQNFRLSLPAVFSGVVPAMLSICASRLLFSLHGLADELAGNPTFVLNNVELSRLHLRKGTGRSEFYVDTYLGSQEADFGMRIVSPTTAKSIGWLPELRKVSRIFGEEELKTVGTIPDD